MKKITTLLFVLFSVTSTLFGQKAGYCDSIKSEIASTVSGSKAAFALKSSSSVISLEWVFGDGTSNSKDATPTHDYTKPGTYTTCVYIISKNPRSTTPCTTKVCKTITIADPCDKFTPSFSFSVGNDGEVTFEASSSNTSTSYTYKWDFGDNTTGSDRVEKHTYKPGTYRPCVTIYDPVTKCTKTVCKEVIIKGSDPCATFNPTMSVSGGSDGVVSFEASTGKDYTYKWNFGDGSSGTDRTGNHTYKPGNYKICVTVTDPATKCTKTLCKEITIKGSNNNDTCKNFNPMADITVDEKGVASYKASPDLNYKWDFGDGSTSTDVSGTHQYKPGTYKACVTITDPKTRCTKTYCKEIVVKGEDDPCRDFNPKFEYKIGENGVVSFYGAGNTGNTLTYTWSYGDGGSGTGIQTSHTYKPGTYKPCVTIYDTKTGCKKTTCWEITIKGTNTDPCKDFNPEFSYKLDGNVVVFEGQGTNYTYKWTFSNNETSTDRVVKIDFKKPGTYKACVVITDPKTKCTKTVCKEIVIKGKETQDPCKDFNPKVSFQTDGLKVNLEVDGGKGATMEWSFGDGTKGSTDRVVSHTYAKSGKYTICVTVYDAKRQCKKTICFTIEVQGKEKDPCADFNPTFSYKITGNKVTVEGANISGVEYFWSWGDKLGDKGRVADHTYKTAGKYNLCMTAIDPKTKCTKTVCKTIQVGNGQKLIDKGNGGDGKDALIVYPNPVDTKASIVTLSDSPAKISVKDVYGIEVIRYDATPNENNSIDMLVSDLPRGTYYVIVEQDGKTETTKFVK